MLIPDPEALAPPRETSPLPPSPRDGGDCRARRGSTARIAALALIAVTAVWGSTFPMITSSVQRMPAADFLAVRFALAAVVLAVVLFPQARATSRRGRRTGLLLGVAYGGGQLLQTTGMATCSPSVSGFLTGIYVVITPILAALLLRHRIPAITWGAVVLSTAGLAVLGVDPKAGGLALHSGELLVVSSAVLYALHIVGLGAWARAQEAVGMAVWQMATVAAVCLVGALPSGITAPPDAAAWGTVVYTALIAGAAALIVQTWAQAHLPPSRAALVMTTEPVFATAFSVGLGHDRLTVTLLTGGALILSAMLLVEVLGPRGAEPSHS